MNEIIKYETSLGEVEISPETVRRYLVRGTGNVSEQEVMLFMKLCEAQKLNPFVNGEVYLIKYGTQPANMVVGYDTYKRRAEEHPDYLYKENGIVVIRGNDVVKKDGACIYPGEKLIGGWCRVHKWKYEHDIAIYKECAFDEYNKGNAVWKEKPAMMIEKVAISQALREAFPRDFQGLYTPEEVAPKEFKLSDLQEEKVTMPPPEEPEVIITQAQRVELFAKAEEIYGSKEAAADKIKSVVAEYGYDSTAKLTMTDYEKIMFAIGMDAYPNPFDEDEGENNEDVAE